MAKSVDIWERRRLHAEGRVLAAKFSAAVGALANPKSFADFVETWNGLTEEINDWVAKASDEAKKAQPSD